MRLTVVSNTKTAIQIHTPFIDISLLLFWMTGRSFFKVSQQRSEFIVAPRSINSHNTTFLSENKVVITLPADNMITSENGWKSSFSIDIQFVDANIRALLWEKNWRPYFTDNINCLQGVHSFTYLRLHTISRLFKATEDWCNETIFTVLWELKF